MEGPGGFLQGEARELRPAGGEEQRFSKDAQLCEHLISNVRGSHSPYHVQRARKRGAPAQFRRLLLHSKPPHLGECVVIAPISIRDEATLAPALLCGYTRVMAGAGVVQRLPHSCVRCLVQLPFLRPDYTGRLA